MSEEPLKIDAPLTIMLIEDNPLDAELFSEFLADTGARDFQVIHVPRLSQALDRLERGGVDIIFLDFVLPDSDGLNGLAKLRRCAPKVPVIMLTGLEDDEVGLKAVTAGAQDYLVKGQIAERTIWRILRYAIVRKRIEEQLRERQMLEARLQKAQRAESLEILAGGIAHEFNNLLTGILGNVTMAIAELPADSPAKPMLDDAQAAAQRAGRVTAQMLAYSGHGRFAKGDMDLSRLVVDLVPLLEPVIRDRGELVVQGASRPLPIQGAMQELRQVIVSLVTNAAEALRGPDGVVRVVASPVRLAAPTVFEQGSLRTQLPAGLYAAVTVADSGCGIAPENLPRIFDPFFTTKFAGRGLGLASVLGIVRGHGGAVKVASQSDHGTSVQVFLPLVEAAEAPADAVTAGAAASAWRWQGVALVVDSEALIVSLTRKVLSQHGMEVLSAPDWHSGLAAAQGRCADLTLVLMDADRLPPTAVEVLGSFRALVADIPILLWGGHLRDDVGRQCLALPHTAFLSKPFAPTGLLARVHELLG